MDLSEIEKQIKEIEEEIFNTQKNKATEHHIGKLKAKIAKLRREAEKIRQGSTGAKEGFYVKKTGDATVALVGYPSVGKSTLLNKLTGAKTEIASYEFTTLTVIPGVMKHKGAYIQVLDLPGLIKGASSGKGRGREVLSAVRNVDLIVFLVDAEHENSLQIMSKELHRAGLRLNQERPDVKIKKTGQGGITIISTVDLSKIEMNKLKMIASQYLINAQIVIREKITEEQLEDVLSDNRVYLPAFVVINKEDKLNKKELLEKTKKVKKNGWKVISISAKEEKNLDVLKDMIFSELKFIRVYMKPIGGKADMNEPLILKKGDTVEDACKKIHRDFKKRFRYATVSGPSAKHDIQQVGLNHVLEDGDILTIVVSR